ncbi:sensor histidine kinase [Rothia aerolata]|uniref:histidine kinase n=1 Tax=Rothia aerolata TaxID=1812262 RepID=A0A917MVI9_9MICC|nr:HAMP domain-containing sensor histidine kinase [Rothia aerolata]GGH66208.1 two-component sensor histidine kinase [Rothia aerolata]
MNLHRMPRLRTKLTAILVVMLGIACLIIGVSSYLTLQNSLMGQAAGRLSEAAHRAVTFSPGDEDDAAASSASQQVCSAERGRGPLDAPGQGAGTVSACLKQGEVIFSGILDSGGQFQTLSEADRAVLAEVPTTSNPVEVDLDRGDYLVESNAVPGESEVFVITGIPLHDVHTTLAVLALVMALGSAAVIVLAGWLGSWIIRRTMKPLERVSSVATAVAHTNLSTEMLPHGRVSVEDSHPDSEVGAVGFALNQLLDNVETALKDRQRTEDQMRDFIADASHELRTPLAAIRGYSDLIRWTENLSESGEQSVDRIESQTHRMSRLVEDLLLLARLDEGREPEKATVDLTELLIENVSDFQVAAGDHTWKMDLPEQPVEVWADPAQLQQVLVNLLSNARKHTDPGTVVTASLDISPESREALLRVSDNGAGISPDFIDKIFDRFSRADRARSGSDGTTGLGLPIVKAILEAHGGSISVSSRPGYTEFTCRLPLAAE